VLSKFHDYVHGMYLVMKFAQHICNSDMQWYKNASHSSLYNTWLALNKSLVVLSFLLLMKTTQQAETTAFLPLSRIMSHDVDIDNFNSLI